MGKITLYRAPSIADMFRAYQIHVDGSQIGSIKRGETVELDVESGEHIIQLKIDWLESNPVAFEIDDGTVNFECGSNFSGFRILKAAVYLLFPRGDYLWLRRVD